MSAMGVRHDSEHVIDMGGGRSTWAGATGDMRDALEWGGAISIRRCERPEHAAWVGRQVLAT